MHCARNVIIRGMRLNHFIFSCHAMMHKDNQHADGPGKGEKGDHQPKDMIDAFFRGCIDLFDELLDHRPAALVYGPNQRGGIAHGLINLFQRWK
jgi:hypothetical protein